MVPKLVEEMHVVIWTIKLPRFLIALLLLGLAAHAMIVLRLPNAAGMRLIELAPCTWFLLLHAESLVLKELLNLPILPLVLHVVVL